MIELNDWSAIHVAFEHWINVMPIRAESVTDLLNQRRACDVNVALVDVATITLTPFMFHFTINHLMELQVLRFHTSCAVMILTLPFSRFHHFVVLIFTKSGSQLCTVQQDPTVRLQGRDCAADCGCQAVPQTIKQLHSPNLEQVHLDT